jgi:perosamine synthetase
MQVKNLIIHEGCALSDALEVITKEASGICFIVRGLKLVGVITDGDIRRAFLTGATIKDPVELIMKKDYFSLPVNATLVEVQKNVGNYKYIPIINELGEVVDVATPTRFHQIPLVQPVFDGNELEYVTDCILTGWISSQGKYVSQFESNFAKYVGANNALAVSNGTVALHLALVALGIGPGDEVLVPNLTFAAPINAVLYVGATPVLVDVDPVSMAISLQAAEKLISERTRAIIAVHLYGYPADMERLGVLSALHGFYVIEDCAEALGSRYKGSHVGVFGDVATFSFFGNKTITTGEGGMILFKDSSIHNRAKKLRDHGMSLSRRYWHDEVGFNYRLTNLQAAVGVAQLERVDNFVQRKRWIAEQYNSMLDKSLPISLPQDGGDVYNSYWLYTIILNQELSFARDQIVNALKNSGIEVRPTFFPLHRMPPYKKYIQKNAKFPASDWLSDCGISLPSSVAMTEAEIRRTCESLTDAINMVLKNYRI